ncbi:MAG: TPM domain-containing protein [Bacilli bacterium]|nr:TPM domain-containing protein [Bacilli bacterium]
MNKKKLLLIILCICTFIFAFNVYAEEDIFDSAADGSEIIEPSIQDNVDVEPTEEVVGQYKIVIEDDADILTDDEEKQLLKDMRPLSEYGNIAFKSISSNDTSTDNFARNYYHNIFGHGVSNGSLFLVDMDNREIYIFSDGNNYKIINNSKAYLITDNIYKMASAGDYYGCASEAYSEMYTLLAGGKIMEPMRHISNGVLAIVISFFTTFIIVLSSSRVKKANNSEIIKNCDVAFNATNIVGTKTGTHRVYSPVSESSGGSSGGGGGGGGGSSGGGGGHSF